jgi:hypothetical protein
MNTKPLDDNIAAERNDNPQEENIENFGPKRPAQPVVQLETAKQDVSREKIDVQMYLATFTGFVVSFFIWLLTFIKGDYQFVLHPFAAYALRIVAVVIAVLTLFSPAVETALFGFVGWIINLVLNLVIAFGLFVLAETLLMQKDIAQALKKIADAEEN